MKRVSDKFYNMGIKTKVIAIIFIAVVVATSMVTFFKIAYIRMEPQSFWIFAKFVEAVNIENVASVVFFATLPTIIAVTIVAVSIIMIVNKSLLRLSALARAASEIRKGNFDVELVEVNSNDEIAQVSKLFTEVVSMLTTHIKQAESTSKAKSDFLSKMSHEMRTPMNGILGMSEIIINNGDASEKILIHAKAIKQSGNHLLSLINEILDISKVESGKLVIAKKSYLFHSVVNDVVSIIKARNCNPDLKFHVYTQKDIPNVLIGDEVRMRQILLNVLSNALKYTKRGYFSLDIRGEFIDDDSVILTMKIKDTGIGIKPEGLSILFDEFIRLSNWTNNDIEGTGLGLPITRNLLELMGGKIDVESEYGKGSVFTIILPQKLQDTRIPLHSMDSDGSSPDEIPDYRFEDEFTAPDAHILVVDDVEINLMVAKGLLEPYGAKVDLLASGEEAIGAVAANNYDLVLMDQMMPGMDGIETVSIIRKMDGEKYSSLPIVASTANAIVGAKEMFLENGFNDFISKPIDVEVLNNVLFKHLPECKIQKC